MHFFLTEINILGIVTIENGVMALKMVQQFDLAKICFDRSDINKSLVTDIALRHYICSYNVYILLSILTVIDQLACK